MAPAAVETATPTPAEVNAKMAEWPWTVEVVQLKHIKADPAYQRPLTTFVKKIVDNFNPALVGALCLSKRSNTHYAAMDGQTRAEALRRLSKTEWIAIVFHDLTVEQEAKLFALFQTERRAMTSGDRFRAQVTAKDAIALEITEIVEGLGFKIEHNSTDPNSIRAVAALEFIYHGCRGGTSPATLKRRYPELLAATLETIRGAWPDLPDTAKHTDTLRGVAQFLMNHWNDPVDQQKLVRRLKQSQASELAVRAEQWRDTHKMTGRSPKYLASVIEIDYFAARARR